jgi:two-component sensor histidine kinase
MTPRIRISAAEAGGKVRLAYEDSGPGLPSGFDPATGSRLGMQLIQMPSSQIGATLSIERGRGARYVIEFETGSGLAPNCSPARPGREGIDVLHDS